MKKRAKRQQKQSSNRHMSKRAKLKQKIKQFISSQSYPRLEMFGMLFVAGLIGLIVSFLLRLSGVEILWIRYLIAVSFAYGFMILLLWLWFRKKNNLDLSGMPSNSSSKESSKTYEGNGGDFGGAGADGEWVESPVEMIGESIAQTEEFAIPIAIVIFLFFGLFMLLYSIYIAPALLAEIFIDGLLVSVFYRQTKSIPFDTNWLKVVVKHTWLQFLSTALLFVILGLVKQS